MFELFSLPGSGPILKGYHWPKEDPVGVILLIHGVGEHAGRYDTPASWMQERNFSVISMDLPGHGKSPGPRGHAAPRTVILQKIDDLITLASARYPDKPLFLYGHSMGGNIALDHRKRGLQRTSLCGYVISAPWLELVHPPSTSLVLAARILSRLLPGLGIRTGNVPGQMSRQQVEVNRYDRDPLIHGKISVQTAVDCTDAALRLLAGPDDSNSPVLLMHGTGDTICSMEGSKKLCAMAGTKGTLILWDGSYHEIHHEENGKDVIQTALDWMEQLI